MGRWLAAPVIATTDLPPWDNSAMDGYAIRAADTAAARRGCAGPAARHRRDRGRLVRRRSRSSPARPSASRPARRSRPAPMPSFRSRRRRRSTHGRLAPVLADARPIGPLPDGVPRPRGGPGRRIDPPSRPATSRRASQVLAAGSRDRRGRCGPRGRGRRRPPSPCIGGPRVAVLATGDEVRAGRRGARRGRHPRRERSGSASPRRRRRRRGRSTSGSAATCSRRRLRAPGAAASRRGRRGDRQRRRLGRAVRRRRGAFEAVGSDRPLARRRPAGQAVRVRDGGAARAGPSPGPPLRAARATRSRPP